MKILPVLVSTMLVAPLLPSTASAQGDVKRPFAAVPAETVQPFLTEGQAAFNKGDYPAAKAAFETVYQMDPRNLVAINFLQKLKVLEKNTPKTVDQEKQLAGLVVPKVQLKEATIGAVFDYLKTTAAKLSDGKIAVNFVLKLPEDMIKTQTVTLSMTNAPYTEVVKYVAQLANLNVQYQPYAVLVTPQVVAVTPPIPVPAPEPK